MTRARDLANVLSSATSLATDAETAAAISAAISALPDVQNDQTILFTRVFG